MEARKIEIEPGTEPENEPKKKPEKWPEKRLPYDPTPMIHGFPGNSESCTDQVNMYGTYEIQRTADTANFFPAIAQGLPKNADFQIWAKNMEDMNEES